jgi:hypothetical protein
MRLREALYGERRDICIRVPPVGTPATVGSLAADEVLACPFTHFGDDCPHRRHATVRTDPTIERQRGVGLDDGPDRLLGGIGRQRSVGTLDMGENS